MHTNKTIPPGLTFARFKHSRAALLLWTALMIAAGYAIATVSLP